jgi:Plavaka transposase
MPGNQIDELMETWNAFHPLDDPPFANHEDLYNTIDSTILGEVPWESFSIKYTGPMPDIDVPPWMLASYDIWFRDPQQVLDNQISNPDFNCEIDYAAKRVFGKDGQRRYQDLMSGQWAWDQSVSSS